MTDINDINDTNDSKQKRKEEGKRKKRQRIEEAGGVRPRENNEEKSKRRALSGEEKSKQIASSGEEKSKQIASSGDKVDANRNDHQKEYVPTFKKYLRPEESSLFKTYDRNKNAHSNRDNGSSSKSSAFSKHRFGRVMETVPCRNKPRFSTVSIALPGSVLSNCQTRELRTLLVGQIARAATIYHVDEIIVFDDKLGKSNNSNGFGSWRDFKRHGNDRDGERRRDDRDGQKEKEKEKGDASPEKKPAEAEYQREGNFERRPRSTHQEFMARLLQYCECPQYLRRVFFPMHPDLQFAGLLAPVDAPHHVRQEDRSKYREGVVMKKNSPSGNSFVNCGIRNRPVE
jgi:predicted SPOUT superfamily RNA methylase MTH1